MVKIALTSLALTLMLAGQVGAQEPPAPMPRHDQGPPPAMMMREGGPPPMGLHGQPAWWKDPRIKQELQLSDDQIQKIENLSREHRLREIDLRAELEKQSVLFEQQMEADTPDLAPVRAQIDKLAQARAQLEKSQAEMVLAVRHVLTAEQARKLRDIPHGAMMPRPGARPPEGAPPAPHDGPGGSGM